MTAGRPSVRCCEKPHNTASLGGAPAWAPAEAALACVQAGGSLVLPVPAHALAQADVKFKPCSRTRLPTHAARVV